MMKKLILGMAVCTSVFGMICEDVDGMESSNIIVNSSHTKNCMSSKVMKGNQSDDSSSEEEVFRDSSDSERSLSSLSEEEEVLVDKACYDRNALINLMWYLNAMPYANASSIYQQILQRWDGMNVFELVDTGSSFDGYYEKQDFDF